MLGSKLAQSASELASFPGSPLAPILFFVGVRGEPGNEATSELHDCMALCYAASV